MICSSIGITFLKIKSLICPAITSTRLPAPSFLKVFDYFYNSSETRSFPLKFIFSFNDSRGLISIAKTKIVNRLRTDLLSINFLWTQFLFVLPCSFNLYICPIAFYKFLNYYFSFNITYEEKKRKEIYCLFHSRRKNYRFF